MRVIYNLNGTVDLSATREMQLGNPSEEDMDEDGLLEDFPSDHEEEDSETDMSETAYDEFWSDPCWAEAPGILG